MSYRTPILSELKRDIAAMNRLVAEQLAGGLTKVQVEAEKARINKEAADRWGDPLFMREVAATLVESLTYGFENESAFASWFDVRTVGEFESLWIKERRGLQVFWTHRAGYIEESQMTHDGFQMPRDTMGFAVSEFSDKIRANYADTLESLVLLGRSKSAQEFDRRILTTLQAAVPSGHSSYIDATGTGLTATVLNGAIAAVGDAPLPDGVGQQTVYIVGRGIAVDKISDFTGFAPEAQEEIRRTGTLGIYRGSNIVRLRHYVDDAGVAFVPSNEVWVLSGNVGTAVNYGGWISKAYEENTTPYSHIWARRDVGVAVYRPELARRIVVA